MNCWVGLKHLRNLRFSIPAGLSHTCARLAQLGWTWHGIQHKVCLRLVLYVSVKADQGCDITVTIQRWIQFLHPRSGAGEKDVHLKRLTSAANKLFFNSSSPCTIREKQLTKLQ